MGGKRPERDGNARKESRGLQKEIGMMMTLAEEAAERRRRQRDAPIGRACREEIERDIRD